MSITRNELVKKLREVIQAAESNVPEEELAQAIQEIDVAFTDSLEEKLSIQRARHDMFFGLGA